MQKMKALVFRGVNDICVEEAPRPRAGVGVGAKPTIQTDLVFAGPFPFAERCVIKETEIDGFLQFGDAGSTQQQD